MHGGRVLSHAGHRNEPSGGTDIENPSATLPSHDWQDGIRHPHDTVKIGLEQRPDLCDRIFFRRAGDSDPGIVDQKIDWPAWLMTSLTAFCTDPSSVTSQTSMVYPSDVAIGFRLVEDPVTFGAAAPAPLPAQCRRKRRRLGQRRLASYSVCLAFSLSWSVSVGRVAIKLIASHY
jgi:hypothetical protein